MLVRVLLSFVKAFVASFAILVPGVLAAPDLTAGRAALVAALIGALDAGLKAVQHALEGDPPPASGR